MTEPEVKSQSTGEQKSAVPSISLPKGGGAIRGMGEKFTANPVTGTGSMSVPIATSPGRSGFGPQLSLSYDSGAGNGPFGFGWSLSLPSITRKTDKGLPRYFDATDSDVFIISGAEDLVPVYRKDEDGSWLETLPMDHGLRRDPVNHWILDAQGRLVLHEDIVEGYKVRRYRPRIEGLFARIERWSRIGSPEDVHWRSLSKDNILTLYGRDANSRISDPLDASRVYSWLISESRDDKGNGIRYLYKEEDGVAQLRSGQADPFNQAHQLNRGPISDQRRTAQRYLHKVLYGNLNPLLDDQGRRPLFLNDLNAPPTDTNTDWLFEVRFDYGELNDGDPIGIEEKPWFYRFDAFSSYRSGFEVRTCRRCERVLMLHHIPDLPAGPDRPAQPGYRSVVRSTEFTFDDELDPSLVSKPVYSFLKQVVQTGWRQENDTLLRRSLPPLEFTYAQPVVQDLVEEVDAQSLENMPIGLDGVSYRLVDLHGEGVPGILTEQADAWFYKRNWSPLSTKRSADREVVQAKFGSLETVALKPNVTLSAGAEFMDLAGDGQPDVVVMNGPTPGLYEHDEAEGWQHFRSFASRLQLDMRNPNVKFIDLDGDGHADVLISENDAFIWHRSLAEEGFGPAQRVAKALDEEKGPRVVFADGTQSIYLADLSGDGLADICRIRNGEVCYWPNLGYCSFGEKITMDNAPWFDNPDQFDHKRIRLADIDSSGTTDIIYLHRDGVRLYFNQSGNGWSNLRQLEVFPHVDDLTSVMPIDLLGNGTACLAWSSSLPGDARRPMRYLNLMGGTKPHLLVKTINNLGAETRVDYAPSTKFYLQDKCDGKPWITRLPFPVHVVERVETYDHISRNLFVTRYAYHHGYFDGEEREFRGFGMVEQWDAEQIGVLNDGNPPGENLAAATHLPPIHSKTWFHTGAYLNGTRISRQYEGEYFREPGLGDVEAQRLLLDDTVLPDGLTSEEMREACRALKGSMLRQEVYADDTEDPDATVEQVRRASTPYTVTELNFTIRTLQPRMGNRHAVFFTHAREAISFHYERNPADPRIQHALTLEVDDYGNVLKQAAVGYGRRAQIRVVDDQGTVQSVRNPGLASLDVVDQIKQTTALLTYTENQVTNLIDLPDAHRAPLPCETLTFELTGYNIATDAIWFQAADFVEPDPNPDQPGRLRHKFTDQVSYEEPVTGNPCRRPIERMRILYRPDDCSVSEHDPLRLLPLGRLEPLALPGESYKLAFTDSLLDTVFKRNAQPLLDDPVAVLGGKAGDQGGYVDLDGDGKRWWIPSGRSFFHPEDVAAEDELAEARAHFYLPRRYVDPFGQNTRVDFDAYDLLMTETRDALDNRITVGVNDYRVLQPRLVSDPNRNQTEVIFDALGLVVGTAVMGKPTEGQGDNLGGFTADLPQSDIEQFFQKPQEPDPQDLLGRSQATAIVHQLLSNATTRIVYDLDRFCRTRRDHPLAPDKWEPPFAATIARETHVSDLVAETQSKLQISFSYSDGFGREIQKKIQAEPGPLDVNDPHSPIANPRWVGSGWTIFNNKGKPVRQYEPFFSKLEQADGTFVSDHRFEFAAIHGVSPILFYDPAERVIATLHPNHTYEKVVFDPWQQTTYDVNDTCAPHAPLPSMPGQLPQTGDLRTDPDIGAYVHKNFKTLPIESLNSWQTWHEQRIGGELGTKEQNAAQRAADHANTPTTAHFDTLGRPFLTVARNRVVCIDHPLEGCPDEEVRTRVDLDIEGNQREVRDERILPDTFRPVGEVEQRIVMQYAYDMLGNRIRQVSMEAGGRWMLNDVTGKPIRAWDSRGHGLTTQYDALRRPIGQYVRGTTVDSDPRTLNRNILVDKIEYGEEVPDAETSNLRTRIHRHYDTAGLVANGGINPISGKEEAYDFKGNLLRSTRRLARLYKEIPDWSLDNEVQLETETFMGSTRYDALNRPTQSIAPHSDLSRAKRNVLQPVFNEANLLERLDVWLEWADSGPHRLPEPDILLDRAALPASLVGVENIDYDAKGQRLRIDYKNGAATQYSYDEQTFRLMRLQTLRGNKSAAGCASAFAQRTCEDPPLVCQRLANNRCVVQDLHYTYDPAGNITSIRDDAQQVVFFRNKPVDPSNEYVYDALYRLIQATGREHLGQNGKSIPHSYNDAGRVSLLHPGDGKAMAAYTERYVYDAVGNFLQMQHRRNDQLDSGWTRFYTYQEESLIEGGKKSNRLSRTQVGNGVSSAPEPYGYDPHGNMTHMPQLHTMLWDWRDQLRMSQRQKVNNEDIEGSDRHGERTWYVYDAGGQRVRKVTELASNGGVKDERIYLGGFELYRTHSGPLGTDSVTLERETLHVMDDKQRIALVERRSLDKIRDDKAPRQLIRYQFGNHLGSASLELDEQAQIISYEEYSPYGSSTYQAVRSQAETAKRYRYTGKERDEESGLNYHGARYYAAWLGRWTTCDKAGIVDGSNLYAFTIGNPLKFVDAMGFASGGPELTELPKAKQRMQNTAVDARKKGNAGAAKARRHANSPKKNPTGVGKPQLGDEMAHMSAARHNKTSAIPNDIANDPKNIKAMPASGTNARVTNPDGTFRDTDIHAAHEDLLDEIQARNQAGKSPGTIESSVAAQDAMEEAKIKSEYMTREHFDQVKARGFAPPEKGPPVDPRTGKVVSKEAKALKAGEELGEKALEKSGKGMKVLAKLGKAGRHFAAAVPVAGIVLGQVSAAHAASTGDYTGAALDEAGFIPVAGDLLDAARGGVALGEALDEGIGISDVAAEHGERFEKAAKFVGLGENASRTVGAIGAALSSITVAPSIALRRTVAGWFQ